jgi:nicotinamidase-related amidase
MSSESNAALLVMDVQQSVVRATGADKGQILENIGQAVRAAKAQDMPVFYVTLSFRDGYPEVSPRNKMFGGLAQSGAFARGSDESAIHPAVAPEPEDQIVTKVRVSAFAGSDLAVLLRARQIDELILTGISTGGVVLSTLREAADRDFRLAVLSDGCMDPDAEVHQVLTRKVFPRQADVLTVDEWVAGLVS